MKKIVFVLAISIFILCVRCDTQLDQKNDLKYDKVVTKYSKIEQIISKEVNDTFFVFIRLPKNYGSSEKRYPVLYLLDGDISFNMATSIVRYLQFGKDIPDMIIVAPAYGTLLSDDETNYRERDYTFSEIERFAESGSGESYLNFYENELIPFVDSSYRTNNQRILSGYSLGGLFSINVLLRKPNLFDNYIAGSPYLINDIDFMKQKFAELNFNGSLKKIFITVGELEEINEYHQPIGSLVEVLKGKAGVEVKYEEIKNGTHYTCPAEALTYGLKFIFNNNVPLEH